MKLFGTIPSRRRTPPAKHRVGSLTVPRRRRQRDLGHAERLEDRLALAVITPFSVAYTDNDTGDITFAANTLMTAPGDSQDAIDARNGEGPKPDNEDWDMAYVNIDPAVVNSSAATLVMPAGAVVRYAGLFWGGRASDNASESLLKSIKLRGVGDVGYTDFTGSIVGIDPSSGPGFTNVQTYQSLVDVTSFVQAHGAGEYTVANVEGEPGVSNNCAGWALVVAYHSDGMPARNLTVFKGFAAVTSTDPDVVIPVTGFTAPPNGPVNATLGFVTYEGDLALEGDNADFDGGNGPIPLSNAANPQNNLFNSTISDRGVLVTTKKPDYKNQLGFDADLFAADGSFIKNGATSATIRMRTARDFYYPGVVTSAIELYAPKVTVSKSVQDLNGGIVKPGDVLRYTMTVSNDATAYDTAANVILQDIIPTHTAYKAGTLRITAGANINFPNQSQTDARDADQGEFLGGSDTVRFQLGTGAGGDTGTPVGGKLLPGESTTVTFDVVVSAGFPALAVITNTATVAYTAEFTGQPFTTSATAEIVCPPISDLEIAKKNSLGTYKPGVPVTYTITVTNKGPSDVIASTVTDPLPAGTSFNPAVPGNEGWTIDAGVLTHPTVPLASGVSTQFTLVLLPAAGLTGDLLNTATVAVPEGWLDPVLANNTSTDTSAYDGPIIPTEGVPALVVGSDDGCNGRPLVSVLDEKASLLVQFDPYPDQPSFRGGVRVASADVTGDGVAEIIVAPSRSYVGEVRVFSRVPVGSFSYTLLPEYTFYPFGKSYRGGVEVASGDFNGDGVNDMLCGQSTGAGLVSAFLVTPPPLPVPPDYHAVSGTPYFSFRGFPSPYAGGVMVGAGDFGSFNGNGQKVLKSSPTPDGRAEVVVGSNAGMRATVKIFSVTGPMNGKPTLTLVRTIQPFAAGFSGGVTLSVSPATAQLPCDLYVGAGIGGKSAVEVYKGGVWTKSTINAFAVFGKPNARVFAAAIDILRTGVVDDVFGVQGLTGAGGTNGVLPKSTLVPKVPTLKPALRIAPIVDTLLR